MNLKTISKKPGQKNKQLAEAKNPLFWSFLPAVHSTFYHFLIQHGHLDLIKQSLKR